MIPDFYQDLSERLRRLESEGSLRTLRPSDYGLPRMTFQEREYLNLSSNDYLALAADPVLAREFLETLAADPAQPRLGSSGSRLMSGNHTAYHDFETLLEDTYRRPALVFGSGYHANTGILPALAGPQDLILADRLSHASLLDGAIASRARLVRYRHNDYEHLEALLREHRPAHRYAWIVSETLFSMDGDRADLPALTALKHRYDALLYLDEAHSVATLGPQGLGCLEEARLTHQADIAVYPLGKAMASHGAYALCREETKQYLVNTSRPLIFSTSLPPVCIQWSACVFRTMLERDDARRRLAGSAAHLRKRLAAAGYEVLGDSHIVPVIFGTNETTLAAAGHLRGQGLWATAIRHPTVPRGQARIRLSLSSAFTPQDIERIARAFETLPQALRPAKRN